MAQAFALAVFLIAYALIATERVHKVTAALSGAGVMLAVGLTDGPTAFHSQEAGIDWNVIFLLLGMMIIVGDQGNRRFRVSGDRRGQAGSRPAVRGAGDAVRDHGGGVGAAGQRHHGVADRAGDVPGVRPGSGCGRRPT